jgi:hypothetical protein
VAVASRVQEHRFVVAVAGHRTAHVQDHLLVAVVVEVGERDGVARLEMAGARGLGDVQEPLAVVVLQHDVGHQGGQRRRARAEVHVEVAVVVEVAEVGAHRGHHAVEPHARAHVGEGAVAVVPVEGQGLGDGRQLDVVLDELGH